MTVTRELIIFLYFILEGMIDGAFLDVLRAFRHNRNVSDIVVCFEDILYWVILGCGVIWLDYFLEAGAIRIYMIFAVFLGMLIYFLTLTNFTYKVFDFICRYLLRLIEWLINVFKGASNEKKSKLA